MLADIFKSMFFAIVSENEKLTNHVSTILLTITGTADTTMIKFQFKLIESHIFQTVIHRFNGDFGRFDYTYLWM